ncbi:Amino-acid acetyltransferase, mitochondrial [Schizosaccharomyces pombe]
MQKPSLSQDLIWILKSVQSRRSTKGFLQKHSSLKDGSPNKKSFAQPISSSFLNRISITKIDDVDSLSDNTLYGIGRSINSLARLGIQSVIVPTSNPIGMTSPFKYLENGTVVAEKRKLSIFEELQQQQNRVIRVSEIFSKAGVLTRPSYSSVCQLGPEGPSVENVQGIFQALSSLYTVIVPSSILMPNVIEVPIDGNEVLAGLNYSLHKPNFGFWVDRIVILDKNGGMPCSKRQTGSSHVLINLAQEFDELAKTLPPYHRKNLILVRRCLKMLPDDASALITTPEDAMLTNPVLDKNPLIHNVLTDRSIISCSLPRDRSPVTKTTVLRSGVPVYTFLGPKCLTDGSVSWERLWVLINDSFKRTLDMDAYLDRLKNSLAAVIIAGDYLGTAIVTYEQPDGTTNEKVPYLDKLAVSQGAQGSAAISDVMFNVMTDLFPKELIWRSRLTNPVNKWYFERSVGSLKSSKTPWKLFWTGDSHVRNLDRVNQYMSVIDKIQPTWLN